MLEVQKQTARKCPFDCSKEIVFPLPVNSPFVWARNHVSHKKMSSREILNESVVCFEASEACGTLSERRSSPCVIEHTCVHAALLYFGGCHRTHVYRCARSDCLPSSRRQLVSCETWRFWRLCALISNCTVCTCLLLSGWKIGAMWR